MSEFAEWRYHKTHGAKLFTSEVSLANAGDGWLDHPLAEVSHVAKKFREDEKPVVEPAVEAIFSDDVQVEVEKSPVEIVAELTKPNPEDFVAVTPKVKPEAPVVPAVAAVQGKGGKSK